MNLPWTLSHSNSSHSSPFHSNPFHSSPFHSSPFHSSPFHSSSFRNSFLRSSSSRSFFRSFFRSNFPRSRIGPCTHICIRRCNPCPSIPLNSTCILLGRSILSCSTPCCSILQHNISPCILFRMLLCRSSLFRMCPCQIRMDPQPCTSA